MKYTQNKGNKDMPSQTTRTRVNAIQREAATALYGIENFMAANQANMRRIVDRVPNGWRDYRLALMTISKLISNILDTIPEEQLRTMANQMAISEIRIVTKSVSGQEVDGWVMSRSDIAQLLNYAVEGACLMCDDPNGYDCPLRKMMGELPVTPDGRASAVIGCRRYEE